MLWFFIGFMAGGMFGIFIMCLMTAASRADNQMERYLESEIKQGKSFEK